MKSKICPLINKKCIKGRCIAWKLLYQSINNEKFDKYGCIIFDKDKK